LRSSRRGMPNAGFQAEGDRIVYPKSSPEYFALSPRAARAWRASFSAVAWHDAGAHPCHGRAVKSLRPAKTHAATHSVTTIARPAPTEREPKASLEESSGQEKSRSVEIDPPRPLSGSHLRTVDKVMASKKWTPSHQQRRDGARGHGRPDHRRRSRKPAESKPFHISRRATSTSLACKPRYSARGPLGRPQFLRSPATPVRRRLSRNQAASTKSIPSAS